MRKIIVAALGAFGGTLGYGYILNAPKNTILPASFIGLAGYIVYILLGMAGFGTMSAYFFSTVFVSVVCELLARKMRTPSKAEQGRLSPEAAGCALEKVRKTPGFSQRTMILAYALAAASFCLLFDGDAATFAVTFAIGVLVQAIQPLFAHIQMGVLLGNFVGGWLTAVAAQMLYGVLPIYNVNAAIIGGIMPLLSGLAMTTAVRDTMYGDLISGMTRALEAMLLATAVAIGVYTGLKMAAMMGGIAL